MKIPEKLVQGVSAYEMACKHNAIIDCLAELDKRITALEQGTGEQGEDVPMKGKKVGTIEGVYVPTPEKDMANPSDVEQHLEDMDTAAREGNVTPMPERSCDTCATDRATSACYDCSNAPHAGPIRPKWTPKMPGRPEDEAAWLRR